MDTASFMDLLRFVDTWLVFVLLVCGVVLVLRTPTDFKVESNASSVSSDKMFILLWSLLFFVLFCWGIFRFVHNYQSGSLGYLEKFLILCSGVALSSHLKVLFQLLRKQKI